MTESSRRSVLACAGAACVAVVAGCSGYNSNSGLNASQGTPSSSPPAAPAASGSGGGSSASAGGNAPAALAKTSDVPVGGGTILTQQKIVITQPQSGTFHAFTAVCTHAGCTVGSVANGTINCPCHGSRFNISNGAVVNGPAASPLASIAIKVEGTSIVQA